MLAELGVSTKLISVGIKLNQEHKLVSFKCSLCTDAKHMPNLQEMGTRNNGNLEKLYLFVFFIFIDRAII